jgi:hypothetical protein
MANEDDKRKWFEEIRRAALSGTISQNFSHGRTKPVVVEKVKKRAPTRHDSQSTEGKAKSDEAKR